MIHQLCLILQKSFDDSLESGGHVGEIGNATADNQNLINVKSISSRNDGIFKVEWVQQNVNTPCVYKDNETTRENCNSALNSNNLNWAETPMKLDTSLLNSGRSK